MRPRTPIEQLAAGLFTTVYMLYLASIASGATGVDVRGALVSTLVVIAVSTVRRRVTGGAFGPLAANQEERHEDQYDE